MKKFVAVESARPKRGRYSFRIYRVKYNNLIYIGDGDMQYSSTRGAESEVMNELIDLKELPKKYYGYYQGNKSFSIKYIIPFNQA